MTTEMTTFGKAGLPSAQSLATALRSVDRDMVGGVTILKFAKGEWSYGSEGTEPKDGVRWAVNPFSFVHGFIAWGDGTVEGEVMVPAIEALPDPGPAPSESLVKKADGSGGLGWQRQSGCMMKCLDGDDANMIVRFTSSSEGGRRALKELRNVVADQIEDNPSEPVAIVTLGVDSYKHKTKGKIYTPVIEVLGYMGLDGEKAVEEAPQPEERRRRRRTEDDVAPF